MKRSLRSLDGLSIGDGFGETFFTSPTVIEKRLRLRELPPAPWDVTDDTMMALSIIRCLQRHGRIDQDHLAQAFAGEYVREPMRGYGGTAHRILSDIGAGHPWREAAGRAFNGQGSCGNGGAMRVAPLGAYFADDYQRAVREAILSAEVTHAHPDGQTGAAAVALAAAWMARQSPGAIDTCELIPTVLNHLPHTLTYHQARRALSVPLDTPPEQAAVVLGNGSEIVVSDTVPFCLWCVARHPDNYPEALWATAGALGDVDTTCAIVGGILAAGPAAATIPDSWLRSREPLTI